MVRNREKFATHFGEKARSHSAHARTAEHMLNHQKRESIDSAGAANPAKRFPSCQVFIPCPMFSCLCLVESVFRAKVTKRSPVVSSLVARHRILAITLGLRQAQTPPWKGRTSRRLDGDTSLTKFVWRHGSHHFAYYLSRRERSPWTGTGVRAVAFVHFVRFCADNRNERRDALVSIALSIDQSRTSSSPCFSRSMRALTDTMKANRCRSRLRDRIGSP